MDDRVISFISLWGWPSSCLLHLYETRSIRNLDTQSLLQPNWNGSTQSERAKELIFGLSGSKWSKYFTLIIPYLQPICRQGETVLISLLLASSYSGTFLMPWQEVRDSTLQDTLCTQLGWWGRTIIAVFTDGSEHWLPLEVNKEIEGGRWGMEERGGGGGGYLCGPAPKDRKLDGCSTTAAPLSSPRKRSGLNSCT